MFMHVSCIRTNIVSILLILNYLVLFCVFLSLFLFLSISCLMAPKCKSTSSWNPLHSGASSSSPSANFTPSHVRFHDNKACKDFSEKFSQRGIHSECQVVLSDFSDTDLPIVIYNKGWESLCGIPVTCPSIIIREFYSNMHGFDYFVPQFITRIRGTRIAITLNLIFKVLHIPRVEFANYLGCEHHRTVQRKTLVSLL